MIATAVAPQNTEKKPMTLDVGLILAAIVVLILLSAFFNASETALTAASRARMHALEQEGNAKARLVNRLLRQPEKMIGAVLLGNTLVDILAASLASVLDLRSLQVLDIMVHRTKMQTIDIDDGPQKVVDEVLKSQHTRIPLWKDEPDNIVGVLHTKDLLVALSRVAWDVSKLDMTSLAAQPWFVPDTTSVTDQLNEFLKRKAQLALVVDEYGEVQGLLTLEDILEEIVGQIADEHDVQDVGVRVQADGSVNVDGTVAVRDLNRQMDWDLPDEEATTIAGLVIHEAQTIPEPGQVFTFYGYRFEILRKNRNKITALRIKPIGAPGKGARRTLESDAMEAG
jgi:Mg2+/Co2+ transporter CorB